MTRPGSGWTWIREDVALAAHDALLAEFGGLTGVRDRGGLQSCLARAENLVAYGSPDAAALPTAYAFGLIRAHPFADGNKRTGFALALVFLLENGMVFEGSDAESVLAMVAVAAGEMGEEELAGWLRSRVRAG